jgi:hypothetical protein
MINLEIPLGKRTPLYRFFEMLPALLSYGAFILLFVLAYLSPLLAAIYLLLIITTVLVKAAGIAIHMISGQKRLEGAQNLDWAKRLRELEDPKASYAKKIQAHSQEFGYEVHRENLRRMAAAEAGAFPRPSELYNAVIIAAYNESYEVLEPTIQSLADTHYNNKQLILVLAYEERGGADMEATAKALHEKFAKTFKAFHLVKGWQHYLCWQVAARLGGEAGHRL